MTNFILQQFNKAKNYQTAPVIKLQEFQWNRTLRVELGPDNSTIKYCRNSIQGKLKLVDETGLVCPRRIIQPSGCCPDSEESHRPNCKACKNNCCTVYETCVSCCLKPDNVYLSYY